MSSPRTMTMVQLYKSLIKKNKDLNDIAAEILAQYPEDMHHEESPRNNIANWEAASYLTVSLNRRFHKISEEINKINSELTRRLERPSSKSTSKHGGKKRKQKRTYKNFNK